MTKKQDLKRMQMFAFELKASGRSLDDIAYELRQEFGVKKTHPQISTWIKQYALQKSDDEELMDMRVQRAQGLAELEDIEKKARKLLDDKYIDVEYHDRNGELQVYHKPISPMIYNMLLTTLLNTVDKKNQLRGLHNSQTITTILQQFSTTYNSKNETATEFANLDSEVQKELAKVLGRTEEVGEDSENTGKLRGKEVIELSTE